MGKVTIRKGTKVLFFLFICMNIYAQKKILTKTEMLEDFDQIVSTINDFAVHKDLNAFRLGINHEKEYTKLRNQISEETTVCDFMKILWKVTFLVQDGHCSLMPYSYLKQWGKYQKKINFKDDEAYKDMKYYDENCTYFRSTNLRLPLLYKDGSYYFYVDAIYKNDTIFKGTKVLNYSNDDIKTYIKSNYDKIWPIKWDKQNKNPYETSFYTYGDENFQMELEYKNEKKNVFFNLKDSIVFPKKLKRTISFGSQPKEQVLYFKAHNILYIGMPLMDINQAKSITAKVDSVFAFNPRFSKIIIDIRGNGGGSDFSWRNVIAHLIPTKINFTTNTKYKYTEPVLNYYNKEKKRVLPESIALLGGVKYWNKDQELKTIEPHKNSIRHKGNIYIVQDENIYSSAGNFSNFSINSDKLISVGNTTDVVGGLQTDPLFTKLNNSGAIFRVEPMLDFSDVTTIDDFSHNDVEVKINTTVEDYYIRSTYPGNIYGQDFLLKHDKLIRYVIEDKNPN
nr:S41 family peptidase [uncultured Psychroserpens sp.]